MYRFFVEPSQIEGNRIHITGQDVHHISHVLRCKSGEQIAVSNGDRREYTCYIEEIREDEVLAHVMYSQETDMELPCRVYLFQGLAKGEKMEWIIQKAVELGAWEIIPVASSRCVVRYDDKKAAKKVVRWQQISESAAKQSKRLCVPEIHPVCSFKNALEYARDCEVKLIPYELAEDIGKTKEIVESIAPGESVAIFIGPEGGFTEEEVEMAKACGITPITLGKRILRTETAGMTLLSILMFHLEGK